MFHLTRKLVRLLFLFCLLAPSRAQTADLEAETQRFLTEAFTQPPPSSSLWLTAEHKPAVRALLGHDYPAARLRYWRSGRRTAWVLDEIGKEMPITVGVVVDDGRIERMRVLAYRESRGWEVQSPNFLRQFAGAGLSGEQQLDRAIDGISGATLSVRAMTRLAKLALWLHPQAMQKASPP
ncbi:MAG: FMN-binding protein [Betaproteobacteria bacterium HGW-Betaproteobacteria-11]|nr:MAG: FMN-binding protein [Betaproteobacteria bacterium HGW-Betaproteobacteria-11]